MAQNHFWGDLFPFVTYSSVKFQISTTPLGQNYVAQKRTDLVDTLFGCNS